MFHIYPVLPFSMLILPRSPPPQREGQNVTREGRRSAKLPELPEPEHFASLLDIEEEKKLVKDMLECYFNFMLFA